MSSDSSNNAGLSRALSSLNIGDGEINNEKREAADNIITATILCAACGKEDDESVLKLCSCCKLVKYWWVYSTDHVSSACLSVFVPYSYHMTLSILYSNRECQATHRRAHKKVCPPECLIMPDPDEIAKNMEDDIFMSPMPRGHCKCGHPLCDEDQPSPLWRCGIFM